LNTLFINTQGTYLSKEGDTVLVRKGKEKLLDVPIHNLEGIVCFGRVLCSPYLMSMCAEKKVGLSFLSTSGRFLARVQGPVSGNVLLRKIHYRKADDEETSAEVSKWIVLGKVINCRTVISRANREHTEQESLDALSSGVSSLSDVIYKLKKGGALNEVRGWEGEAAKIYFGVFDHLVLAQKDHFFFRKRTRRPPLDNLNALLSFLYTLLVHDVVSGLESVGLDPAVGFLHRDRPGRPSLALDITEEFRPILADRIALSLINLKQIRGSGFMTSESGAVTMDDETRKKVLVTRQNRLRDTLLHPFLDERVELGLLPWIQALLMARYLRGDLDAYPPFLWR